MINNPSRVRSCGSERHPSGAEAGETRAVVGVTDGPEGVHISCADCRMEGSTACADCVVSFICDREPDDALIIDAAEARAVRLLGQSGLVPRLRHRARTG